MATGAASLLMQKHGTYRISPYGQYMTYAGACTLYESLRNGKQLGTFSLVSDVEIIRSQREYLRTPRLRSTQRKHERFGFIPA